MASEEKDKNKERGGGGEKNKCEQEREEYLNGWKRARADLENYKKETAARVEEIIKFANEAILGDLIVIMDSFDRAVEVDRENEGLRAIRSQLEQLMEKRGLKPIKTIGEKFNPEEQESLGEMEAEGESGTVAVEIERGWRLYDKVLRPARVKIVK